VSIQYNLLNEQDLIQQLRQGNESAFRRLVDSYRNRVFHTVLNILQDSKEAEDATQETVPEKKYTMASGKFHFRNMVIF
jgi:hypothetical protein